MVCPSEEPSNPLPFEAQAGLLDTKEVVELTMTVALANFTNRINDTLRTDLEH